MVSGTISLPCSGCFSPFPHGTGTLSVSREYLALPDGPGRFTQDSSCPALLRIPLRFAWLRVRSFHALRPRFPARSARHATCDNVVLLPRACRDTHGLGSSPFARHYWGNFGLLPVRSPLLGESRLFSFPAGTKMFQFPALASRTTAGWRAFSAPGCPIRRSADQRPFAPTRGFSQLITSFLASESQGIRHVPLLAFSFFPAAGGIIPPPAPCATCHRTLPRTNAESGE